MNVKQNQTKNFIRDNEVSSIKQVKVIAIDFDNCLILDEKTRRGSEDLKDEAWFKVFAEYERHLLAPILEKVKQGIAGGKGDRTDVIERVCQHFGVPQVKIAEEVVRRSALFNSLVQAGIGQIGVSQKIRQALATLAEKFPLYINTATPRLGVMESLKMLGLTNFFKGVYGMPGTKMENLMKTLNEESVNAKELLLVDDQETGWQAAQEVGCQFIGIQTARNQAWHKAKQPFPIIYSLSELLDKLIFFQYN